MTFPTPLILGWHTEYFHFIGLTNVYAPVGSYNTSRILNIGLNRWAFEPNVGITFVHPKYGQEVSLFRGYTVNFRNSATDYTTGNEFHLEDSSASICPKALPWVWPGFDDQQVTNDRGAGAGWEGFVARMSRWVPAFCTYNTKIADTWWNRKRSLLQRNSMSRTAWTGSLL